MYAGQVAVSQHLSRGETLHQVLEQPSHRCLLGLGAGVGGLSPRIVAALVAHPDGVSVVAYGMCTDQLFVARLVGLAVTGDVVVVTRESEPLVVVADEGRHWVRTVAARGRTVDDYQVNLPHTKILLGKTVRQWRRQYW